MSRSYRAPYWCDGYGSKTKKLTKRMANRAVRNSKEVASGKAYKKVFSSYDICDFKFEDKNNYKVKRK